MYKTTSYLFNQPVNQSSNNQVDKPQLHNTRSSATAEIARDADVRARSLNL